MGKYYHYEYQTNDEYGCHSVRERVAYKKPGGFFTGVLKGLLAGGAGFAMGGPVGAALGVVGAAISACPAPDSDMSESDWNASIKKHGKT